MLTIGYRKADRFILTQQNLGNDVRWDGWDMVFFRPAAQAIYSKDGTFRDGSWGYLNAVEVNDNGLWVIDFRNIKKDKSAGHKRI